jgi:hypothetical protein
MQRKFSEYSTRISLGSLSWRSLEQGCAIAASVGMRGYLSNRVTSIQGKQIGELSSALQTNQLQSFRE